VSISTARLSRAAQGARTNYTNPAGTTVTTGFQEPPDHAIGRSRGGLTSKIHLVADGRGRPLSLILTPVLTPVLTPGNINDTTMLAQVIDGISVARSGPGRPRTRSEIVQADKGYPSRANRAYLAARGIKANIPDRDDQIAHRLRRGQAGRRPPGFDAELYRRRNLVERSFNRLKNWRGIATRVDKTARNYRAGILLAATLI
jgi:transposase